MALHSGLLCSVSFLRFPPFSEEFCCSSSCSPFSSACFTSFGVRLMKDHALVFMAKWPEAGRSKTRLTPALSPIEAADLARCFLLDMLAEATLIDADRWLAFTPASAGVQFRALCGPDVGLIPAETSDLGLLFAWLSEALSHSGIGRFRLSPPTSRICRPSSIRTLSTSSNRPTLPSGRHPTVATTFWPPSANRAALRRHGLEYREGL